jgi:p-hydroxybenzoate 3-monooxygenase
MSDASSAELDVQVAIIGAGPAGLMLAQLLSAHGIQCCVLERQSRAHVESRVRAGVLEQATVESLRAAGVGQRLDREGIVHHGIELRFGGAAHRIDFESLVPGRSITVYGQREVVRDLIEARLADQQGGALWFEVSDIECTGADSPRPVLEFSMAGGRRRLTCDWVVGCDGFHGVSRHWLPSGSFTLHERTYPIAWLGVLAAVPPSTQELIYAAHEQGFALHSMRSAQLSRFYLQVPRGETLDRWSDERIWTELRRRLETVPGWRLASGPILERGVSQMRSVVVEPMRRGRLFLAGDAAHIVPATGAKGLNLAIADVQLLSLALSAWYQGGQTELLDSYSETCLRRVWRVQHFSSWMTRLLHTLPGDDAFERHLQLAQLDYVVTSRAASTTLAENYVGFGHSGPAEPGRG